MITKLFLRSALDALSSHIAILDEHGVIIEINAAWKRFADENGFKGKSHGVGLNYLNLCDSACGSFSEEASAVALGIRAVMAGQTGEFHLEYPCHSPQEQRWFSIRATRFAGEGPIRVVVAHEAITARKQAEEALQVNERRLRLALAAGKLGVFEHAVADDRFGVSPKYCEIMGLPLQSVISRNEWFERVHPEDRGLVLSEVERCLRGQNALLIEHRLCFPDGSIRWVRVMSSPVVEGGTVARIYGVVQDITKNKELEQELRKLSCAVEQNSESIIITDLQGAIDYVNPRFCAVTGYSVEEVLGKNPRMLNSGLIQPEVYRQMWATLTAGKEWCGEFHNRKKNGELFWEAASISGIRDDTGKVTRFVAVKEDITERKRIEVALRESEERYRALFDRSLDCVYINDFEGRFLDANPAAFALLGYEQEDLASVTFSSLLIPEHLSRAVCLLEQLRTVGTQLTPHAYTLRRKDGRLVEMEVNASLVMRDGQPHSILGIARDVTERKRADALLREQLALKERLAKIVATAPGIIFSICRRPDGSACIPYASSAIQEFCGVRAEDVVTDASAFVDLISPEDRAFVHESINESARTLLPWRIEFRLRHPTKGLFWVESQATPERETDGSTLWYGFMSDISERKRTEGALSMEQKLFDQLITATPDTVYFKDRESRFSRVNEALARRHLLSDRKVLLGKTDFDLFADCHARQAYDDEQRIMATGQAIIDKEEEEVWTDGRSAWVSTTKMPMRDSAGKIVGIMGISRDITERKKGIKALRESEERFSAAFEFAPIGVALVTPEGRWTKVNRALCALVGYSEAEMLASTFQDITLAGDLTGDMDAIRLLLAGKISTCQMEKRFMHARGNPVNVLIDVSLVRDGQCRPLYFITQVQDITERKLAVRKLAKHEEREARARRELEHERELSLVKSRFVSTVSHEFRTPLAVINAAAHLLGHYSERMSGEDRLGQVEEIQNAVGRMAEMMEDLLVHGNLQSGKMKCSPMQVDVEGFCRRLIAETSNNPFVQCAIELDVGSGAHEAFLDEKLLRCILGNLLSNAVKYSIPGQPVKLEVQRVAGNLEIDADTRTSAGDHLQFKISDSGIGIPAADLPKVFQPFHRASNIGTRPGTGMGLAIVKQSVELHRGAIKVESEEGKGTTFWVWLPLAVPDLAEGSPALTSEPKPPASGEQ